MMGGGGMGGMGLMWVFGLLLLVGVVVLVKILSGRSSNPGGVDRVVDTAWALTGPERSSMSATPVGS